MGEEALTFGDIFEYSGKEYIFLAGTLEIVYVARILPIEDSKKLDNLCNSEIRKNKTNTSNFLLCYIILTTDELKDRAAFFAKPELDNYMSIFKKLSITLNIDDLKDLKKEILDTRATPIGLKEIIQKTEIN